MISVIIPLYNKEKYIKKTLQSVLSQSIQDFEIVIIDDGSTDRSVEEVQQINDSRIRLISQKNQGVSAARNKGIQESRGDLLAFLDADDLWKKDYLKVQEELTKKYPSCDIFVCNYEFVDSKGNKKNTIINKLPFHHEDGILDNYFEVASCSHAPISSISIMVRKQAILSIGGFPIGIKSGEDLITWANLAVNYKIAYSKKVLASFLYDENVFTQDQRERKPEQNDYVGQRLQMLYIQNQNIIGLKKYNALWHKMRSRIFLEKGFHFSAFKEALISAKFHLTTKIIVFMLMSFLPVNLVKRIFKL